MSSHKNATQKSTARGRSRALLAACCLFICSLPALVLAQGANRLERIEVVPLAGDQVELRFHLSNPAPQPIEFEVDNPARISLDFPDTTIALPARRIDVKRGALDTVTAAEANGRTRVVLNLDSRVAHETPCS